MRETNDRPLIPTPPTQISPEKVAKRAYEKWCRRGKPHGTSERDWLEAEAELHAEASSNGVAGHKK